MQSTEQLTQAMSDCLSYLYKQTEAKEEEESKTWLSLFDFVRVFTAFPPLKFLSWLDLWGTLPSVEKGKDRFLVDKMITCTFQLISYS